MLFTLAEVYMCHTPAHAHTHTNVYLRWKLRRINSQERLDVHLQSGAGQRQLEAGDDVRVEDSQTSYALTADKDVCAAPGEEGGI